MEGNHKIIEKILADANSKAEQIVATAEARALEIADQVNRIKSTDKTKTDEKIEAKSAEIMQYALANAELEVKKYRLKEKQHVIDDAFSDAYLALLKLDGKDYLDFLTKLLKKYAEKGETVHFAKKDSKIVTQSFLDTLNLSLKLGNAVEIDGGAILEGKGYEKNLTLKVVVASVKEQTEMQVARILFDGA